MQLPLSNKKLQIYLQAKKLVLHCFAIAQQAGNDDVSNLKRQLKTSATTVYINIAQGLFKKKKKRPPFFRAAADALVVLIAILDLFAEFNFINPQQLMEADELVKVLYTYLKEK